MAIDRDDRRGLSGPRSVALFIDWDNFAIGLRQEMPDRPADVGPILRWSRRLGTLSVCRAYGEWREPHERLAIYNAGVEVVYAPVLPLGGSLMARNGGGAKSLADTAMAVDVTDLLNLMPSVNTIILATSDKDLIPVLRFAQRRGLHAVVVGSDRTASALRDLADEFISYRQLLDQEVGPVAGAVSRPATVPPVRYPRVPRVGGTLPVPGPSIVPAAAAADEPRRGRIITPRGPVGSLVTPAALPAPAVPSPSVRTSAGTIFAASEAEDEDQETTGPETTEEAAARRRRRGGRRRRGREVTGAASTGAMGALETPSDADAGDADDSDDQGATMVDPGELAATGADAVVAAAAGDSDGGPDTGTADGAGDADGAGQPEGGFVASGGESRQDPTGGESPVSPVAPAATTGIGAPHGPTPPAGERTPPVSPGAVFSAAAAPARAAETEAPPRRGPVVLPGERLRRLAPASPVAEESSAAAVEPAPAGAGTPMARVDEGVAQPHGDALASTTDAEPPADGGDSPAAGADAETPARAARGGRRGTRSPGRAARGGGDATSEAGAAQAAGDEPAIARPPTAAGNGAGDAADGAGGAGGRGTDAAGVDDSGVVLVSGAGLVSEGDAAEDDTASGAGGEADARGGRGRGRRRGGRGR